jgi:hypothetical protein
MAMNGFSFHFNSHFDSAAARNAAAGAQAAGRKSDAENTILRAEIERLLMITEALWEFLKQEHGYSDEDLIKRIAEIDIRDGKLDGRVHPESSGPKECPDCGRPIGRRRPTCLYCGTPLVRGPFDRS